MGLKTTHFESVLEAVPDALVGMDQKGAIRFVNRQTEMLFGHDREHLIGRDISVLVPEVLWQVYEERRGDFFADPTSRSDGLDLELNGRHQNGGEFPINVSLSSIDTGDVLLTITAVSDVTRQKQAVAKAELLDAIVSYSDEAITGADLNGIITSWNPAAKRMFGYSSKEALGADASLLMPKDRAGDEGALLAKIKEGVAVEHFETMRVRKDGTVFPISLSVAPVRDEDGAVVGATAVVRDVTEQRNAFQAAQRLAAIVESTDDSIIGKTLDGIITSWNAASARMYGYSGQEIVGKPIELLIPKNRPDEIKDILAKVKAGQMVGRFETERVRKDGTVFPVSLTVSPIRDPNGAVIGASTIAHDVTELRQALALAQDLIEASSDAMVGVDQAGVIRFVNRQTELLFGYGRDSLVGQLVETLVPESSRAVHPGQRASYVADPVTRPMGADLQLTGLRRDGTEFPVDISLSSIQTKDGMLVTAAVRDLTEQVQKERALAEASRQYRLLAENASDLVVMTSPDRVITWVSPSLTRSLGWAVEDLMGKGLLDLVHPDDAADTAAPREVVYCGHEVSTPSGGFLMRFRTKFGQYRWMAGVATPVTDESGVVTGVVTGLRDVDDLVQAREAAESDRATLRATLDSLMDPHVLFEAVRDDRGQIVDFLFADANSAACAYVGIAYEDLVGSRMLGHYPGVVGAGLMEQYAQVVETGELLRLDDVVYAVETMGGQDRHLDISAARVGDGLSYTWRDVTERHEALEYVRRMAAVVEQTHDAIIGVSLPDTLVTSWNRAAERMYGYTAEEVIGKTVLILTPKDQIEQSKGLVTQLSAGEPVVDFETVRLRKDGTEIQVSMSSSPIRDANGVIIGVSTTHRDITKAKAAREEAQALTSALKTSNDSLRDFVAVASHDLRSPLVTIGGFAKILTDNWATLSDEDRLKQLGAIQRGVDRLSRLTNDLLTSAKVEGAAEQIRPEHIRLATALANYLEADREKLGTVGVTCPPELVAVVDQSHLTRILDNYLGNAFKYGEPPVCIEVERVGDFVELRVRDHGPGVPPEFVSRLFTKFGRLDTPTTRATQGTGLGLSIVKALAEANHGDVRYQQDEPKGGCFVVRLPAAVS